MKFLDTIKITFKAGDGGAGCATFFQDWMQKKPRPDGGNGGNGGNIILIAKTELNSLFPFKAKPRLVGFDGANGNKQQQNGKHGKDLYLQVPIGTIVLNPQQTEVFCDFTTPEQTFIIAFGGKGGLGNAFLSSKFNHNAHKRQLGTLGEEKTVCLDLRFIADVGLIGLPNVGKSSLLNVITHAVAKIGNYPFTTLTPNLGILTTNSHQRIVIADLPGIIKGAYLNKGLGNQFLKHAQRCRLLVHVVDLSQTASAIVHQITLINNELFTYNRNFRATPQIILGNKVDLIDPVTNNFAQIFAKFTFQMVSATVGTGLATFKQLLIKMFQNNQNLLTVAEKELALLKQTPITFHYPLAKHLAFKRIGNNQWELDGKIVKDLLNKFDINTSEGLVKINYYLKNKEIVQILKQQGLQTGDLIYIVGTPFYWKE